MRVPIARCLLLSCWALLILVGCTREAGRVHAKHDQLVGLYEAKVEDGTEQLELKDDGTYLQDFRLSQTSIRHAGKWTAEDHILDAGTQVNLMDAIVSKGKVGERTGLQILYAHRQSGTLALALNEPADWYFVKIR